MIDTAIVAITYYQSIKGVSHDQMTPTHGGRKGCGAQSGYGARI